MQDFSNRLRLALKDAGMSQNELARRLNLSQQTVNSWTSGRWTPRASHMPEMCRILDVDPAWLLCMTNDRKVCP